MIGFAKSTLLTMSTRIINLFAGIFVSIIIARLLGPEGKGVYSLVILLPTMLVTVGNLGIGTSAVYYIANGMYDKKNIIGTNIILALLIGVIISLCGFIIVGVLGETLFPGISRSYLFLSIAIIPCSVFFNYNKMTLLGVQDIIGFNAVDIAKNATLLISVTLALYFLQANVLGAIVAYIISVVIASIVVFWIVLRKIRSFHFRINKAYINDALSYGIKTHLSNVLAFLNYRLDIFLVNFFLTPAAVGFYSISVSLVEKLWILSQSASTVLLPKVAGEKDEESKRTFTPIVCRIILWITLLGAVLIYFLGKWIIVLLYSEAFLPSIAPFKLLLPGIVALSASRVLANDIAARGKPILNTYLALIMVCVNVILNILWIPKYGIEGAAIASTVAYGLTFIGRTIIYCKISNNNISNVLFLKFVDFLYFKNIAQKYLAFKK